MKKLPFTLSVLAPIALLAACGGSGNEEPTAGEETTTTGTEAPTADPEKTDTGTPAADNTDTVDGTALADFTGDAAAGERIFMQCQSCHAVEPGQNRIGPSLAGIIGSDAGTVDGFRYSDANSTSGINWTREKMFQYLENPRRVIPKTTMAFAGLRDAQDRADMIAYLETVPAR